MFCKYCGKQLSEDARFCPGCGKEQGTEVGESVAAKEKEKPQDAVEMQEAFQEEKLVEKKGAEEAASKEKSAEDKVTDITINSSSLMKAFGAVAAVVFAIYFLKNFFGGLGSLFSIVSGLIGYGWHSWYIIGGLTGVILMVIGVLALLMALIGLLINRYYSEKTSKSLFVAAAVTGALSITAVLIRSILLAIGRFKAFTGTEMIFILAILIFAGGFYGLLYYLKNKPVIAFDDLQGTVMTAFGEVKGMAADLYGKAQEKAEKKQKEKQTSQAGTENHNAVSYPANAQGPAPFTGKVQQNRSLFLVIILTLCTCGLYTYYFIYKLAKDMNTVCAGDGEKTPGMIKLFLLSMITCGIYAWCWYYKIGNRMAKNAPRYGITIVENGTTVLMWLLFGSCLCGIGSFIGVHIIIKNANTLCKAYNAQALQTCSSGSEE